MRKKARAYPSSYRRFESDADPQIAAVYAWEDGWLSWNLDTLTLEECRVMVRTACRLAGLPVPVVVQHEGMSEYDCTLDRIAMQKRGRRGRGGKNPSQVLHEVAHYVVFKRHGWRPADHGPTFMRTYIWLMSEARIAPRVALEASARAVGIRF